MGRGLSGYLEVLTACEKAAAGAAALFPKLFPTCPQRASSRVIRSGREMAEMLAFDDVRLCSVTGGAVLKTSDGQPSVGSNPTLSASVRYSSHSGRRPSAYMSSSTGLGLPSAPNQRP